MLPPNVAMVQPSTIIGNTQEPPSAVVVGFSTSPLPQGHVGHVQHREDPAGVFWVPRVVPHCCDVLIDFSDLVSLPSVPPNSFLSTPHMLVPLRKPVHCLLCVFHVYERGACSYSLLPY